MARPLLMRDCDGNHPIVKQRCSVTASVDETSSSLEAIMNKLGLAGVVLALGASIATTALAFKDTADFQIAKLEMLRSSSNSGHRIYPAAGFTFTGINNPAGCTSTTAYAEVHPSASAAEKVLMNSTLLAAFLAGKKVSVRIAGATCSISTTSGAPAYEGVRMVP